MHPNWLDEIWSAVEAVLGLHIKAQDLGFQHMAARAVVMYVALVWVVRSGKKRFLGRVTAFDTVLVIMLGSIAARALTGGTAYFPAILALFILIGMHWAFSYAGERSQWFSGVIKGHDTVLIKNGRIQHAALRDAHMSRDDLDEDLRQQGVADVKEVAEARLERSGQLSVIKN